LRVAWLYLLGFLSNTAVGILVPALPLYLQGMGATVLLISVIIGIYGLLKTMIVVYFGHLSDSKGRNTVMILELASLSFFSAVLALVHQPFFVLLLAIPYGLAGNLPTIASASVGDFARGRNINLPMGGFMLSIGLGFAVGNYTGGYVTTTQGFGPAYYMAATLALASILIVLFALKDAPKYQQILSDRSSMFQRAKSIIVHPKVAPTAMISFAVNIALGLNFTFFPLLGTQLGFSAAAIGLVLAVRALASTGIRGVIGYVAGVHPRGKIILMTPLLSGLTIGLMWFASSLTSFLILVPLEGVSYGIYLTLGRAEVADAVRGDHVGLGLGLLDMFAFSGQMLFVLVLGSIAANLGLRAIYPVGAVVMLLVAGLSLYPRNRQTI
jgi:MFS family permease